MTARYAIRGFDPDVDDADRIAELHLEVRRWQVRAGQNSFPDILDSQADLRDIPGCYLTGGNFFVAMRAGTTPADATPVGFVGIRPVPATRTGELKRLAVLPGHHRRGLGLRLVRTAVAWATLNDFDRLRLHTGLDEQARAIYERCGFTVVGRDDDRGDLLMVFDLLDRESLDQSPQAAIPTAVWDA